MKAINLNSSNYYVTGITFLDTGREITFDEFKREPIVCPSVHRYGPEVEIEVKTGVNQFWKLPPGCGGYTISFLTCEMLNSAQHEVEGSRAESHAEEQLKKYFND